MIVIPGDVEYPERPVDICISAQWSEYCKGWHISADNNDGKYNSAGSIIVKRVSIPLQLPAKDILVKGCVESFKRGLEELRAKHYIEQQAVQEHINKLLALPHHV